MKLVAGQITKGKYRIMNSHRPSQYFKISEVITSQQTNNLEYIHDLTCLTKKNILVHSHFKMLCLWLTNSSMQQNILSHTLVSLIQQVWGGAQESTCSESLPSSLLDSLNHQRADSRSKKHYNPAACGPKTTFT